MGCSPSKGKLFSKPDGAALQKTLLAEAPQDVDFRPAEEEDVCLKPEEKGDGPLLLTEKEHTEETRWTELDSDTTAAQNTEHIKEVEVNLVPREIISDVCQADEVKTAQKKNKNKRRSTGKQKKSSIAQTKVDFPSHMVRAHQAAYTFLNPNISKYKTLLGLLEQTAQTQLSLQPMMTELVLQFEEMNQALEEMAEEGELMLMEHGDYMALPSGMMSQAVRSSKPTTNSANHPDPPPDLMQQLLQHSVEKMRQVGSSVQALGDTTLQEAVEYFSSLSKLLAKKLQAKQAAERRLVQVLARVEGSTIRKSNPEDSALHSEDSGIGGENESLTGSERNHRHRGSAGSGGSGVNIQGSLDHYPNNSANRLGHNDDDEGEQEDEEQDEEETEDDENSRPERKRSSSSPPDPSQAFCYMFGSEDQQPTVKRVLSAARSEHSASTGRTPGKMELQKSLDQLDPKRKQGMSELSRVNHNVYRVHLKRHSLNGPAGPHKGPTNQPPCLLPSLPASANPPTHRHSIRRLINTFSQGVDGRPGQSLSNVPPHIMRPSRSRNLPQADVHRNEGGLVLNDKNNNNNWSDGRDNLDVDNLPPPPLEVLMDNSFQSNEGQPQHEKEAREDSVRSLPVINQKTGRYHRQKTLMQNVEVLPNRANVRPRSAAVTPARPAGPDAAAGVQHETLQLETEADQEAEEANSLYQQARKIIHLRHAVESPDQSNAAEQSHSQSAGLQARLGHRLETNRVCESELCSLPVTAPPVSRVRLPPSCPSVRHRFPSPPAFRPQSTSRPTSRPSSPRTPTNAKKNSEVITPSVSFQDARLFFCRNELQNSQACPSFGNAVHPRQQGEASRGRLCSRGLDPTGRRTQSENRTGGTSPL